MFCCDLPPVLLAERPGSLRAVAVTWGTWNGYPNKSQYRKFSRRSCGDSNPRPFYHKSDALTTVLSPLHPCPYYSCYYCFSPVCCVKQFCCCFVVSFVVVVVVDVVVAVVVVLRFWVVLILLLFKNVVSACTDMSHNL